MTNFKQRELTAQLLDPLPGRLLSRRLQPVEAASPVKRDLPLVPHDKANHPSGGEARTSKRELPFGGERNAAISSHPPGEP